MSEPEEANTPPERELDLIPLLSAAAGSAVTPSKVNDAMANRRSRRPPPLNLKAASPVAPYLQSSSRYPLPQDEQSLKRDVQKPFPPERSYVDDMMNGLRQDGPSGQPNSQTSPTSDTNDEATSKPRARRLPVKYRPPSPEFVPRINRPFDEVHRRLREGTLPSRRDQEKYRGVQYSQQQESFIRDDIPDWYIKGQAKLKNPLKYGQPGSSYGKRTSPPRRTLPPLPMTQNAHPEMDSSVQTQGNRMNLPTTPPRLIPTVTIKDIVQVSAGAAVPEDEVAIQKDIEDAMKTTEQFRESQRLSVSDKGSSYVQNLRRNSFTSPVKNGEASPAADPKTRSESEGSEPEGRTIEGLLEYYAQSRSEDDSDKSPEPNTRLASIEEVLDDQWGSRTWYLEAEPLSPSQPVLVQVGVDDDDLYKDPISLPEAACVPEVHISVEEAVSSPAPAPPPTKETSAHALQQHHGFDDSVPPPIPPKRRHTEPHSVIGSASPPREIKSLRHQPVLVQDEDAGLKLPPIPPKIPLSPILEATRTPTASPQPAEVQRPLRPSQEYERSQAVIIAAEAEAEASIAAMAQKLKTEVDDHASHNDHLRRVDKAFKKMGVIPEEVTEFATPSPASNKITKDLNRMKTRKAILENDGPKSPPRKMFNLGGTPKSFKAVVSIFGLGSSKAESVPNSPKSQRQPRRPSLDPALLVDGSSRPGVFQRLFGSSSRPSTSDSNKSFGISLPESWGSARASGETGATSNVDNPSTPPANASSPGYTGEFSPEGNSQLKEKKDSGKKTGSPTSKNTDGQDKKGLKQKRSGFFDIFKRDSGDEKTGGSADEASSSPRKQKGKSKANDAVTAQTQTQTQPRKSSTAGPGFYGSKGTFFRAKNPLELELCDDSDIEEYRPTYMRPSASDEDEQPVEQTIEAQGEMTPPKTLSPVSISVTHQLACQSEQQSPDENVENLIVPGVEIANEPPSWWSDDSEDEAPFTAPFKSHKRTGSGSSALGNGPLFMMKAVQKFKVGSKKSTPSPEKSEEKYIPPPIANDFPPHVPPPRPRSNNRKRTSATSATSSGKSESDNQRNSIISPPPIPPRARPTPTGTPVGTSDKSSQESTKSPTAAPITSGTYHDQSQNVVHKFGGNLPERSGSSMGHRADRASVVPNMPERSRSSLGQNIAEAANTHKSSFFGSTSTDKAAKTQAKKLKKVEQDAKKEAAKVEKLTKKAEAAAQRHAEALNRAGLLSPESHGQWKLEQEEAKKPKEIPEQKPDPELEAVLHTPDALKYFVLQVRKELNIKEGELANVEVSRRVFNLAKCRRKDALKVAAETIEKEERQKWYREFELRRQRIDYDPVADLTEEEREQELKSILHLTDQRRKNLVKLLGQEAMNEIVKGEAEAQRGWLFVSHRRRERKREEERALLRKIEEEKEEWAQAGDAEKEREEKLQQRQKLDALRYAIWLTENYWPDPADVDLAQDPHEILEAGLDSLRAKQAADLLSVLREEEGEGEGEPLSEQESRSQLMRDGDADAYLRRTEESLAKRLLLGSQMPNHTASLGERVSALLEDDSLEVSALKQAHHSGEITREEYNYLTRPDLPRDTAADDSVVEEADDASESHYEDDVQEDAHYEEEEEEEEEEEDAQGGQQLGGEEEGESVQDSEDHDDGAHVIDTTGLSEEELEQCRAFEVEQQRLRRDRDAEMAKYTSSHERAVVADYFNLEIERRAAAFESHIEGLKRRKNGPWANVSPGMLDRLDRERLESYFQPDFDEDDYPPPRDSLADDSFAMHEADRQYRMQQASAPPRSPKDSESIEI
ncbi:hypothetical protein Dda_4948 [Drechslerella dactyloides]|uniref:Uncharacterized protein n=1 Tax=Drechslerella dactyloides TaxID=74499 RepID=A0AAD6IZB3_DREDA|nr:hypothetical protein Dda_4948 [Drechslerella dactyloides]